MPRTHTLPAIAILALPVAFVVTSACRSNSDMTPQETATATTAVAPAISINAMMVALVDHSAHAVWDAAAKPPTTEDAWQQLEYHAMQLAAAGTLISTGGTGPADPGWVRLTGWRESSQRLTDDGVAALGAARQKDVAALSTIGERLLENCESCHKEFKPDVPTEGLVHRPEYSH